jgi:cell division protein FtsL
MRIFRISNILSLLAAVFFGVLLFWTSQAVQDKESALKEARKKLAQERESLRVFTVEWDYLNRPQRLEQLAKEQLGMELPSAKEVVRTASEIPEPLPEEEFGGGAIQTVSTQTPKRQIPVKAKETVSPDTAEKQSFEKLIQSLDAEGGGQ